MTKRRKSVDHHILYLIEHFEKLGVLKLSASRFRPAKPKRYAMADMLRTRAAAEVLQVSPRTLANWRLTGAGPVFAKTGALVTYRYADLQAFIADRIKSSTSDKGGLDAR